MKPGNDAVMVVVDRLSKQAHAVPTTSDVTASGVAWLFRDHVWKLHGLPEEVISDQGTQFVSNFTCSLSQLLKIRIAASTAYHPQTNGQTESVNQEFEQFLSIGWIYGSSPFTTCTRSHVSSVGLWFLLSSDLITSTGHLTYILVPT